MLTKIQRTYNIKISAPPPKKNPSRKGMFDLRWQVQEDQKNSDCVQSRFLLFSVFLSSPFITSPGCPGESAHHLFICRDWRLNWSSFPSWPEWENREKQFGPWHMLPLKEECQCFCRHATQSDFCTVTENFYQIPTLCSDRCRHSIPLH